MEAAEPAATGAVTSSHECDVTGGEGGRRLPQSSAGHPVSGGGSGSSGSSGRMSDSHLGSPERLPRPAVSPHQLRARAVKKGVRVHKNASAENALTHI